jgi:hypothetical protein
MKQHDLQALVDEWIVQSAFTQFAGAVGRERLRRGLFDHLSPHFSAVQVTERPSSDPNRWSAQVECTAPHDSASPLKD